MPFKLSRATKWWGGPDWARGPWVWRMCHIQRSGRVRDEALPVQNHGFKANCVLIKGLKGSMWPSNWFLQGLFLLSLYICDALSPAEGHQITRVLQKQKKTPQVTCLANTINPTLLEGMCATLVPIPVRRIIRFFCFSSYVKGRWNTC